MTLTPKELERISTLTLAHYNQRADAFWEGTRDHDVSQNIAALLQHIEAPPPFAILDFGCGPGRDLKTFKQLGHSASGLEGSARLAAMAREYSGCDVLEQSFLELDLPASHFDGVFANAALFHVPSQELPRVLVALRADAEAGRCAVQLEPPRRWPGGLVRWPLRRLLRFVGLARPHAGGRIRRADPLLSSRRTAARTAVVAGECVAQTRVLG